MFVIILETTLLKINNVVSCTLTSAELMRSLAVQGYNIFFQWQYFYCDHFYVCLCIAQV